MNNMSYPKIPCVEQNEHMVFKYEPMVFKYEHIVFYSEHYTIRPTL